MKRFLIVFPLCLLAGFGLLLAPFSVGPVTALTSGLVSVSAATVKLCGGQAVALQDVLQNHANGFAIKVEDTCNASNVTVLLWAAILAFPAQWLQRLKGLAVGTVALHAVNLLRVTSLFYLGQHEPTWFEFTHLYVWEGLMMLVTLVIFWNWVRHTHRDVPPPPAS